MMLIVVITSFLYSFLSFTSDAQAGQAAAAAARPGNNISQLLEGHLSRNLECMELFRDLTEPVLGIDRNINVQDLMDAKRFIIEILLNDKVSLPTGDVNGNSNTTAQAAAAASSSAGVVTDSLQSENLRWIQNFYERKVNFVAQRRPDILPYFDLNILKALACNMDTVLSSEEDKGLREIYLWKLFLNFYEEIFQSTYKDLASKLEVNNSEGTIPLDFIVPEDGLYKDIVTSTLKSFSDKKILHLQKVEGGIALRQDSKEALVIVIKDRIDIKAKLHLDEFNKRYRKYSSDKKVPAWVQEFVRKDPKVIYNDKKFVNKLYLRPILVRMAHDMNECLARYLKEEEKKCLENERIAQEEDLVRFYEIFYEIVLKNFYDNFIKYKTKKSLPIEDEEVISSMSEEFEKYPYNIFQMSPLSKELILTEAFLHYFTNNVTQRINSLIKSKSNLGNTEIPMFFAPSLKLLEQELRDDKDNTKGLRSHEMQELARKQYGRQQQLLEAKNKKYAKEQNERLLRLEQAAENKAKKKEEEQRLKEEQRRAEEEKKKRDEERNKLRSEEGLRLQSEKSKQLTALLQKRQEITSDFEEKMGMVLELFQKAQIYWTDKELQDFRSKIEKLKELFSSVTADIDKQKDKLTQFKDKFLKKEVEEFTSKLSNIEGESDKIEPMLQEIRFELERFLDKADKAGLQTNTEKLEEPCTYNPCGLRNPYKISNSVNSDPASSDNDPALIYFDTVKLKDQMDKDFSRSVNQRANQRVNLAALLLGDHYDNCPKKFVE